MQVARKRKACGYCNIRKFRNDCVAKTEYKRCKNCRALYSLEEFEDEEDI